MTIPFIHPDFLLTTEEARRLYHDYAEGLPIIDYHCHLPPDQVAEDRRFANLTRMWLYGDHYKWRAMRTNGIDERYCTGDASDREKFDAWAATVPKCLRNPLYHWTHLELNRPFGIDDRLLSPATADSIWADTEAMLGEEGFSTQGIMRRMNVEVVCTTDDPVDDLAHHLAFAEQDHPTRMLPTFRPDKAMKIEEPEQWKAWIHRLEAASGKKVDSFATMLDALQQRMDVFHAAGCRLSDHGLDTAYFAPATPDELEAIFARLQRDEAVSPREDVQFKTGVMLRLGRFIHEHGWTMQLHLGAMRNNRSAMYARLGPDIGFDSVGDEQVARPLSRFLDALDSAGCLPRTILYNLNPTDNYVLGTMIGNFQDGNVAGKLQFGAGWWFCDHWDGMTRQMEDLSNLGLLARFVGMLTDSRSFLSYPRHEYFRRLLCEILGRDMARGYVPRDFDLVGGMVADIAYRNAKGYFGF